MAGLAFVAAAAIPTALAAILCVAAATADAGTINAGLVDASEPERRGAFLAVQALSGFGASAVTPILFGLVLDLAGGGGSETAWVTAFAAQAANRRALAAYPSAASPQGIPRFRREAADAAAYRSGAPRRGTPSEGNVGET